MNLPTSVRRVEPGDERAWKALYTGYRAFYELVPDAAVVDRVWTWVCDDGNEVEGLVALDADGRAVGLAHFRPFARPLAASTGGFLDDLFVVPEARGSGAAQALIEAVAAIGRARGWSVVRWITAEDNDRARAVYDRLAARTRWVTYDLKLG